MLKSVSCSGSLLVIYIIMDYADQIQIEGRYVEIVNMAVMYGRVHAL